MGELVYGTQHVAATTNTITNHRLQYNNITDEFDALATLWPNTFTLFIYWHGATSTLVVVVGRHHRVSLLLFIQSLVSVCRVFILYFCASIRINGLDIVLCSLFVCIKASNGRSRQIDTILTSTNCTATHCNAFTVCVSIANANETRWCLCSGRNCFIASIAQ